MPEFIAPAIRAWMAEAGLETLYIELGAPWENGYAESFSCKVRDELTGAGEFTGLPEAEVLICAIGGGSSCAGATLVAKALKPALQIIGVQAARACSAFETLLFRRPVRTRSCRAGRASNEGR